MSDALSFSSHSAVVLTEARDAKLEPDLQPLRTLREVDMICHLWQQYVTIALLPLANSSVTLRREMAMYNNQTLSRVEGAANGMLQKTTDGESFVVARVGDHGLD